MKLKQLFEKTVESYDSRNSIPYLISKLSPMNTADVGADEAEPRDKTIDDEVALIKTHSAIKLPEEWNSRDKSKFLRVFDDSPGKYSEPTYDITPSELSQDASATEDSTQSIRNIPASKQIKKNVCVAYNGPGKTDSDAGSCRSDYPVDYAVGFYYYECTIENPGEHGYIGIGFGEGPRGSHGSRGSSNELGEANQQSLLSNQLPLNRLPGWEPRTWGYHADDGNAFGGSGQGKKFGPTFDRIGDCIGCGVVFWDVESQANPESIRSNANFYGNGAITDHPSQRQSGLGGRIFYTKNGVFLGWAFENILDKLEVNSNSNLVNARRATASASALKSFNGKSFRPLYPMIGMRTRGECVSTNFAGPFKFDLYQFLQNQHTKLLENIYKQSLYTQSVMSTIKPGLPSALNAGSILSSNSIDEINANSQFAIQYLILQHLIIDRMYLDTARAFAKELFGSVDLFEHGGWDELSSTITSDQNKTPFLQKNRVEFIRNLFKVGQEKLEFYNKLLTSTNPREITDAVTKETTYTDTQSTEATRLNFLVELRCLLNQIAQIQPELNTSNTSDTSNQPTPQKVLAQAISIKQRYFPPSRQAEELENMLYRVTSLLAYQNPSESLNQRNWSILEDLPLSSTSNSIKTVKLTRSEFFQQQLRQLDQAILAQWHTMHHIQTATKLQTSNISMLLNQLNACIECMSTGDQKYRVAETSLLKLSNYDGFM